MTRLIALETSGTSCSIAVHVAGVWFENTQNVDRLHNEVLLVQLQALLAEAAVSPRRVELIVFAAGPGSFTGIRLAAAAAQALAFASGARIVPVSSSEALVTRARALSDVGQRVVTVTRSRRDAYYVSGWDQLSDQRPRRVLPEQLLQGDAVVLPSTCHGWEGVGDMPPWWKTGGGGNWVSGVTVGARTVGEIGLKRHLAGESVDAAQGLPIYVAGDSPWKPSQPDPR